MLIVINNRRRKEEEESDVNYSTENTEKCSEHDSQLLQILIYIYF